VATSKRLKGFLGLNTRDHPASWPWWTKAQNVMAASGYPDAQAILRPGTSRLFSTPLTDPECHGLFSWISEADGLLKLMFMGEEDIFWSGDWTAALTVDNCGAADWTWAATDLFNAIATQAMVYLVNGSIAGYGTNWRFDGTNIHPMGLKAPTVAPGLAVGAGGALTGTYAYVYTYYDPTLERESDPSPAASIDLTADVCNITTTATTDASATKVRLYRTVANGSKYFFVKQYDPTDTTDELADNLLGYEVGDAGTNKDTIGFVAKCIALMSDGRVVIANDVTNARPRRLAASYDNSHPESFPLSSYLNAGEENGYEIVALVPLGDELCVICEESLWMLNTTCTSCTRRVPDVGGVGPWCGCSSPWGVFFISHDGVYLFDGATTRRVSDVIRDTWDSVVKWALHGASIVYDGETDHVLVSVMRDAKLTENDTILALDCKTILWPDCRWSIWTVAADKLESVKAYDGVAKYVVFSHNGTGILRTFSREVYADQGVAIPVLMQSGPEELDQPTLKKLYRRAHVEIQPVAGGTLTVGLATDAGAVDDVTVACSMTKANHRVSFGVRGRAGQLSLAADMLGYKFRFIEAVLEGDVLERRAD